MTPNQEDTLETYIFEEIFKEALALYEPKIVKEVNGTLREVN